MSTSTTATAAATSSVPPTNAVAATGVTSSLYLYTFLATLVILLGVSGAIVLRSFTIRRRTQRLVEEAIRNGTYVPPEARVPAHLMEKPKLHDTHIGHGAVSEKWADYRPVSAVLVTKGDSPRPVSASTTDTFRPLGFLTRFARWDARLRRFFYPRRPVLPVSAPAQDRSDPSVLHNPSVRVAVLIAMPSQYPDRALSSSLSASPSEASISEKGKAGANGGAAIAGHGDGESAETELPHVVFGIAELPIIASQQLSSSQSALRDAPMGRDMNGDQV